MFTEQKNSLGTSRLFAQFLPRLLCHLQIDAIVVQVAMFYSSLQVAISQSRYSNLNLKPKQVQCLEAIYSGRDVVAVLPTGYGKSLIFDLLPSLFFEKLNSQRLVPSSSFRPVVIVVSPLNALIKDQIRRSSEGSFKATCLNAKMKSDSHDLGLDASDAKYTPLKEAKYVMVFTHSEAFVSCKDGMELFQSPPYQRAVKAVIVDEAAASKARFPFP